MPKPTRRWRVLNPSQFSYFWGSLALLWASTVAYFSLLPVEELPDVFRSFTDLLLHAGAYFGLSFALSMSAKKKVSVSWGRLAAGFLFGVFLEIIQPMWSVSRHFSLLDVSANSVGIFLGTMIALFMKKRIFNPF